MKSMSTKTKGRSMAAAPSKSRHGYIPVWLLIVYAVLFLWGFYYAYHYWGGVGPGRIT